MKQKTMIAEKPYYFQEKTIQLSFQEGFVRYPKGFEWFICFWNMDIFYWKIPFCKILALVCILISLI